RSFLNEAQGIFPRTDSRDRLPSDVARSKIDSRSFTVNLIQFAREMTKSCAGTPEIMRCELLDAGPGRGTDSVQASIVFFTQRGTETVRIWPPFPTKSAITKCSSRS